MITLMLHEHSSGGFSIAPVHGANAIAIYNEWERKRRFVISESGNRDPNVWRHIYQWAHDHCTQHLPCFVRVVDDVVPGDDIDYPLGPQDQISPTTILYPNPMYDDPFGEIDDTWDDDE